MNTDDDLKNGNPRARKTGFAMLIVGVVALIGAGVAVSISPSNQNPQLSEPISSKVERVSSPSPSPTKSSPRTSPGPKPTPSANPDSVEPVPGYSPESYGQRSGAAQMQPVQPVQPTYDVPAAEPDCPLGSVSFSLSSVVTFKSDTSTSWEHETVAKGVIANGTTGGVHIDLSGEAHVVGLDTQGNVKERLYAEVIYTPPVGIVRPISLVLQPGGELAFQASSNYRLDDSVAVWVLDPDSTGTYLWYEQNVPYGCNSYAEALISSGPIGLTVINR